MLLQLTPADLTRIRFCVSPWWEAVTSVLTLAKGVPMHRRWIAESKQVLTASPGAARKWDVLRAFITANGHILDGLTPTPSRDESFQDSKDRVLNQDANLLLHDLRIIRSVADHPAAPAILDAFEAEPHRVIEELCDAVEWVWRLAVEPHWERIHALQVADIDYRLRLLSRGGLDEVLRTLHPQVLRVDEGLDFVGKSCDVFSGTSCDPAVDPAGPGLTLIPCVFAWPGTVLLNARPYTPTVSYAPRGVGSLWEVRDGGRDACALSDLMGGTRAAVLAQLDIPMTTKYLARHLDISPATVSEHLKVLSAARLLEAYRRGREVFYRRTSLADELLKA
ncbi:DNA-binding transcriptional ArsR family regulator [Arthrobacter woluwensis]|uniref:ArsR/SmtB family transcription factor n=1 Tax=Arthrobacter woluwensis TaxID=156980 RepID=UPI002787A406|nr:helix-turn-helix domain-containing protein [Arthrobacter woluwensis]MDQ0709513.1 DNA-binding transcriptional ArsR family regulator [Arthrobacter woluwensis]